MPNPNLPVDGAGASRELESQVTLGHARRKIWVTPQVISSSISGSTLSDKGFVSTFDHFVASVGTFVS